MSETVAFPMPSPEARELTIELFAAMTTKLNNLPGNVAAEAATFTLAYVLIAAARGGRITSGLRKSSKILYDMSLQPAYLETLKTLLTIKDEGGAR